MLLNQDSLTVDGSLGGQSVDSGYHQPSVPRTPYQVLRMLPKNATPAQQDSAIQAWFQPGEIHYSEQPDTLHLPGYSKGRSVKDVSLPQYYRENFFSNDTLYHPEIDGGLYGMAGDPVPYTVRNDNLITGLLLLSFITLLIIYAHSRGFLARQYRELLLIPHGENAGFTETPGELRIKALMSVHTCLLFSIFCYFYTTDYMAATFIVESDYLLILIFFGLIVGYLLVKGLLYTVVNCIFFDGKRNIQFLRSLLLIAASQGVLLFPIVLLMVYFDLSLQSVVYYFIGVVILGKLLIIYKSFIIFFRQNAVFLQIILYFCALEIVPLVAIIGSWVEIVDRLKVNI